MRIDGISRRSMLQLMATGAAGLMPAAGAKAQAKTLVAATYPGGWEEAHRKYIGPVFTKATGASLSLTPVQGLDQVAKIVASKGNPPYDVALLPTGPMLQVMPQNVLLPFPAEKSKNIANVPEAFRRSAGPDVALQIMGIAYNPERIKTPPTSWKALWDPSHKGRVGLCSMTSGLGTAFMLEIARMTAGDPYKMDAALAVVRDLLPNVAAIANNPATLATLFQQGEVDIAPQFLNEIEVLRAKGVPIALARPETGWACLPPECTSSPAPRCPISPSPISTPRSTPKFRPSSPRRRIISFRRAARYPSRARWPASPRTWTNSPRTTSTTGRS